MAVQNNFFELLGDEETDASAVIERAVAMEKVKKKQQEEAQPLPPQGPPKLPSKPSQAREFQPAQPGGRRGRGGHRKEQGGYGNREQGSYGNRDRDYNNSFNSPSKEGPSQRNQSFDRSDGDRREGNGFESNRGRFYRQGRSSPFPAEDGEGGQKVTEGSRGRGRFYGGGRWQGRGYWESVNPQGAGGAVERQQQRAYVRKDAAGGVQDPKEDKPEGGDVTLAKEEEESVAVDKQSVEEPKADASAAEEKKEEEEEGKVEMLLDEYYKVLNEKNKHLKYQKADERKVVLDKDLARMVVVKKQDEGDFVKLGSEKDKGKKRDGLISKDDKLRKNISINEFLKPMQGEEYYGPVSRRGRGRSGRGRGRGLGLNEGFRGAIGGSYNTGRQGMAPHIEDPSQFPTLGGAK